MPTTDNQVKFKHGTEAQWTAATKDGDTIYFLTDTKEIALGSDKYGSNPDLSAYMPKTGGTFTGTVTLPSSTPTTDYQAATKKYVDDAVQGATGGSVTIGTPWDTSGQLVLSNTATSIKTLAAGSDGDLIHYESGIGPRWISPATTPTSGGSAPITSGAVYSALQNKQDAFIVGGGLVLDPSTDNTLKIDCESTANYGKVLQNQAGAAGWADFTNTSSAAASGGATLSLVTTGEKYTWNNKQDAIVFNTAYSSTTNKAATMTDVSSATSKWESI